MLATPTTTFTQSATTRISEADLVDLPSPVQRYLRFSGVLGTPWLETVRVRYRGRFRLGADKPWLGITAEQVYRADVPAFDWRARFSLLGVPLLTGRDTYQQGQGRMFGKLAGLFTIFDATGPEMLQGTMLRFLQEMAWFPSAYLYEYCAWQGVDEHTADVTFTQGTQQVTARLYFDDDGRMLSFIASRYREQQGRYFLNTWAAPMTEYQPLAGLWLPVAGRGVWQLPEGDLPYIEIRVQDIAYNVP
jgi:hypothetical protein